MIIVIAIIALLSGLVLPTISQARSSARATVCVSNLRSVGQTIHAFANTHDDFVASAIRERDYWWDHGKQIGWDIETGRWAKIHGAASSVWQCGAQRTAFIGNSRALGLDNREAVKNGLHHRVGPRNWNEPGRLALAYDLQADRLDGDYRHARNPAAGDLSDETWTPWPRDVDRPVIPLGLWASGPHGGAYGALFADGHARVGKFTGVSTVLWSGLRWWATAVRIPGARE